MDKYLQQYSIQEGCYCFCHLRREIILEENILSYVVVNDLTLNDFISTT